MVPPARRTGAAHGERINIDGDVWAASIYVVEHRRRFRLHNETRGVLSWPATSCPERTPALNTNFPRVRSIPSLTDYVATRRLGRVGD